MAFRKVANVVSSLGINVNKVASTLFGGRVDSGVSNAKEIFAQLGRKSPLETIDRSDTAHLNAENDPLGYTTHYYPLNTGELLGEGHYMIFYIVRNTYSKLNATSQNGQLSSFSTEVLGDFDTPDGYTTAQENINKIMSGGKQVQDILRGQTSGLTSENPTHSHLASSITLYMPTDVKTRYGADYENADTELAGFLGKQFGDVLSGGSLKDALKKGIGGAVEPLLTRAIAGALSIIPGVGDINAAVDKGLARAINPQQEFVFKRVPFRTFTYPFRFAPRNEKEMSSVYDIINMFKYHMLPEFNDTSLQGRYFRVPSEFEIRYMYRDRENLYLPKVSRCALTNMNVDYAPEGQFKTFYANDRGAPPVIVDMNLEFTEMEIMTKETIAKGY